MMNFREAFKRLKTEKENNLNPMAVSSLEGKKNLTSVEKAVEDFLEYILLYYRDNPIKEMEEAREIIFVLDSENNIRGKMYDMGESLCRDFSVTQQFNSKKRAKNVLIHLEAVFRVENYKIENSAVADGFFSVIIY